MEYKEILVTPSMARSLLEKNNTNRRFEPKRATSYAKAMKDGEWELNGEDIAISQSGYLKNGQHRLNAVIIANIPVKMGFKFNVPDDVAIYDRGRTRSTSDIFTMKGMDPDVSSAIIISMIRLHYTYSKSLVIVQDYEIENFIKRHEDSLRAISRLYKNKQSSKRGTRISCKNSAILLGVFYALEAGVPEHTLDDFLRIVYTGIPDSTKQSAAIVLRNDIIAGLFKMPGGQCKKLAVPMVEKAINDFVNNYQRKKSYKGTTERIYFNLFKEEK